MMGTTRIEYSADQVAEFYRQVLPDLVQRGDEWRMACPLHSGTRDSFCVEADSGRWFCHSECDRGGDVLDLYMALNNVSFRVARQSLNQLLGIDAQANGNGQYRAPAADEYFYRDEAGELVMKVVRTADKRFFQYRPDGAGGWLPGITDKTDKKKRLLVRLLPYNLPGVLKVSGPIFIAEGEKDVRTLHRLGLVGTCNPMGAGKWNRIERAALQHFKGRPVVILPDNDDQGRQHAHQVATSLNGIASSIKILELDDLPEKGDVSDWVHVGGTRELLEDLAGQAPAWTPTRRPTRVLQEVPVLPVPPGLPANVAEMQQTYVILGGSNLVWDRRRHRTIGHQALKILHANEYPLWLKGQDTQKIDDDKLVFKPGGAEPDEINVFKGLKMKPDISRPHQRLVEHIAFLCGGDAAMTHWLTCWLAYPLQHLGAKMQTCVIVHGPQGTGKNLLFEAVLAIYGDYGRKIMQSTLEGDFTSWAYHKLYIMADEVLSKHDRAQAKNRIKAMITSNLMEIKRKYLDDQNDDSYLNFVFLSNEYIPMQLDRDDRRFLVIETPPAQTKLYYEALKTDLRAGGAQGLMAYLQAYDTSGFDEYTHPIFNQAKANLIRHGLSSEERFILEWQQGILPAPFICCAFPDLFKAYEVWAKTSGERLSNATVFGRLLQNLPRKQMRLRDGRNCITVIIGDLDDATDAVREQIREEAARFAVDLDEWLRKTQKERL